MDDSKPTRADVEFFLSETADSSLGVYKDGKLVKGMSLHNVLRSWLRLDEERAATLREAAKIANGGEDEPDHHRPGRRMAAIDILALLARERGEHEGEGHE